MARLVANIGFSATFIPTYEWVTAELYRVLARLHSKAFWQGA
jgi:hypothetical protein